MSQIFQKEYPKKKLYDFLNNTCVHNSERYIFSKASVKKAKMFNHLGDFIKSLEGYYFNSKNYYITREMTYKNIVTIVRQLCKYHHIPFSNKICYSKSKYEITYYIYKIDSSDDEEDSDDTEEGK